MSFYCRLRDCFIAIAQACLLQTETHGAETFWSETEQLRLGFEQGSTQSSNVFLWVQFLGATNVAFVGNQPIRHPGTFYYQPNTMFFMATNSSWGRACWEKLLLVDQAGRTVRPTDNRCSSEVAYPDSFEATKTSFELMSRFTSYSGPWLPLAIAPNDPVDELPLWRYYKIKKNGNYKLTIWPKIYRRVRQGSEICKRIDFPPITIPLVIKN